jgi:hypothetical protein
MVCLRLVAANGFPQFWPEQIHHDDPARADDVDMGRWVIVGVNHETQAIDAQHRGHTRERSRNPSALE